MTRYSEDDVLWISKVTALGVRLNPREQEWTMADKLLAPMELFAWQQKRNSPPSEEDKADIYIPIDKDELQQYIPLPPSWKLPCLNFKTNVSYKLHLDEFRKAYVRQYEICDRCSDINPMATWETILKYWRQAALFFLRFWAMHNDLEKLEAVGGAIDVIRQRFHQHGDLERYCNEMLPDFKKKLIAKPDPDKKRARTYVGSQSSSDESSEEESIPAPPSKSGWYKKKRARTIDSDCSRDELSEGFKPTPPLMGLSTEAGEIANDPDSTTEISDEISDESSEGSKKTPPVEADDISNEAEGDDSTNESDYNSATYSSANDSDYNPPEDNLSMLSGGSEMNDRDLYCLDDNSAIDNKDYENEKGQGEDGRSMIDLSMLSGGSEMNDRDLYSLDDNSAIDNKDYENKKGQGEDGRSMIDGSNPSESELSQDNSQDSNEDDIDLDDYLQSDEMDLLQRSDESVGADELNLVELFLPSERKADSTEQDLAFKLEMGGLYSNIRHLVDHLVLHGLTPPGMSEPTWSSVEITMKACGMHVAEGADSSAESYANAYSRWVPVLHLDNFTRYMSSFYEICCNETMTSDRLARHGRFQMLAISRDQIDERIRDYFTNYAPHSSKGPNLEEIMRMICDAN
jgi:hypothetical protein